MVPQVIADHDLVSVAINVRKPVIPVVKTFPDLRHCDKDTFCLLLLYNVYCINNVFLTDDVNKQVYIFNDFFFFSLHMCAPVVTKAVKGTSAPWMSGDIREAKEDRNRLQRELKVGTNNVGLRERYKAAETCQSTH